MDRTEEIGLFTFFPDGYIEATTLADVSMHTGASIVCAHPSGRAENHAKVLMRWSMISRSRKKFYGIICPPRTDPIRILGFGS